MTNTEEVLRRIRERDRVQVADIVQLSEDMPGILTFLAGWLRVPVTQAKDELASSVVPAEPFVSDLLEWAERSAT